jgi:hypothetical protein
MQKNGAVFVVVRVNQALLALGYFEIYEAYPLLFLTLVFG